MTTGVVIARGLASVMAGTPVPPIANWMVSSPGFVVSSFAFVMASRSVPALASSAVFVTVNVAACAGEHRAAVAATMREKARRRGRTRDPRERAVDLSNVRVVLTARKVDEGAAGRCATARSGWRCTMGRRLARLQPDGHRVRGVGEEADPPVRPAVLLRQQRADAPVAVPAGHRNGPERQR